MKNILHEKKWVSIHRGIDSRGIHAEIRVDAKVLPLVGKIYDALRIHGLKQKDSPAIRGLTDEWSDKKSYTERIIRVYPKSDSDFDKWYTELITFVKNTVSEEIIAKIWRYND